MNKEIISKIKVLDSRKLLLVLKSGGKPSYQHIYREAAGVYWDNDLKGFISTEPKDWSYSKWFSHIVQVTNKCGIQLSLSDQVIWEGVSENDKNEILKNSAL